MVTLCLMLQHYELWVSPLVNLTVATQGSKCLPEIPHALDD